MQALGLDPREPDLKEWTAIVEREKNSTEKVRVLL